MWGPKQRNPQPPPPAGGRDFGKEPDCHRGHTTHGSYLKLVVPLILAVILIILRNSEQESLECPSGFLNRAFLHTGQSEDPGFWSELSECGEELPWRREAECGEQVGPVFLYKVDVWALTHVNLSGRSHRGDMSVCVRLCASVCLRRTKERGETNREPEGVGDSDEEGVRPRERDFCLGSLLDLGQDV